MDILEACGAFDPGSNPGRGAFRFCISSLSSLSGALDRYHGRPRSTVTVYWRTGRRRQARSRTRAFAEGEVLRDERERERPRGPGKASDRSGEGESAAYVTPGEEEIVKGGPGLKVRGTDALFDRVCIVTLGIDLSILKPVACRDRSDITHTFYRKQCRQSRIPRTRWSSLPRLPLPQQDRRGGPAPRT